MVMPKDTGYQDIQFVLAEPNETIRFGLLGMLRQQGFRNLRQAGKIDDLIAEINSSPADLIAVTDSLGDGIYDCIKQLRHNQIGKNPFAVVTFMVAPENKEAVKRAVMSGADDVMLKPVAPGKIVERAKHIAYHRTPFIATTEYIGPDRRSGDRKSAIPLIDVVNTLRDKLDSKRTPIEELTEAVEAGFRSIRTAQLDSQGLRMGYVCNLILKAYDENRVDGDVEKNLLVLAQCLEEAAQAAKEVGEPDLADICKKMCREIEDLSENYQNPDERSLTLVRTLTKAFDMAKSAAAARMPKDGFKTN